jgi:hypothetical protein
VSDADAAVLLGGWRARVPEVGLGEAHACLMPLLYAYAETMGNCSF